MKAEDTVELNDGTRMPMTGFGLFEMDPLRTEEVTYEALMAGYRHIDSARYYQNEREAGNGIARFLKDRPDLTREDIYYTTKIFSHVPRTYEQFVQDVEDCYANVKHTIGYIDLLLVHSPLPNEEGRKNAYRAVQYAHERGYTKAVGVSNYGVNHLDELYQWDELKVLPVVDQLELHPWLPRLDIQESARKYGLILQAYSPLTRTQNFEDKDLQRICQKHEYTPAEVLLRWSYDQGFVPIAKTSNVRRMTENYTVLNRIQLDDEDKQLLHKPGSWKVYAWIWDPLTYP